ncbi:MAG: transposase, partial [Candidatus Saccharimonadales bacterium]
IVDGERDPEVLAAYRDRRVKVDEQTIARSLRGNWRAEHLHALTQEVAGLDFYEQQIAQCDEAIEQALEQLPVLADEAFPLSKKLRSPHRGAAAQSALHQALAQTMGVDLTAIPTVGVDTVLVLASEVGPDLSRFPTSQHFCSWLGLAPPTWKSGGKNMRAPALKINNRAAQALRQCALNARNDQSFIGAKHRARLVRMDTGCAVKSTAHQLARWIYAMLTKGQAYVEKGLEAYEAQSRDNQLRALERKARKLGYQLMAA